MLGLRLGLVLISGTTAWQLKSPLHATPARSHTRSVSSPRLATAGEDSEEVWSEVDELDASQTSDAWDDQVADYQRWKAQQAAEAAASMESNLPLALRFPDVDEEAHLDLGPAGGDDEEDPNARMLRQLSEKQAQVMLDAIEGKAGSSADKRVLTSLEAIISTLSKLSDKVDKLSSKLDKLQVAGAAVAHPPSNPAAVPQAASADVPPSDLAAAPPGTKPAASWDGEVDETAWFDEDEDEDDLPDWRDVRRLNNLL